MKIPSRSKKTLLLLLPLTLAATTQPTDPAALNSLQSHLAALKTTTTLSTTFTCEKHLAALDTPLRSSGELWIRKASSSTPAALRFSTTSPYTSDLILADNKIYGRSQHETEWTANAMSNRPGLSTIMLQLAGWSTGDPGKLSDLYAISRAPKDLTLPKNPNETPPAEATPPSPPPDTYLLTPTNKDLAEAVKQITLALDPKTHTLLYLHIQTTQNDETHYWFSPPKLNPEIPPTTFTPK